MALHHTAVGEVFRVQAYGTSIQAARSHTLVRDPDLQIMRLVLQAGQTLPTHHVPQRMLIQCIEGVLTFEAMGRHLTLQAGDICHLAPDEPHAVRAEQAASALVTLFSPTVPYHPAEARA